MKRPLSILLAAGLVLSCGIAAFSSDAAPAEAVSTIAAQQTADGQLRAEAPQTTEPPAEVTDPEEPGTDPEQPGEGTEQPGDGGEEPGEGTEQPPTEQPGENPDEGETPDPGDGTENPEPGTETPAPTEGPDEELSEDPDPSDSPEKLRSAAALAAASAVTVGFQAGNIISDENFYAGSSMSTAQIQTFLNQRVPRCTIGDAGRAPGSAWGSTRIASFCLKNAKFSTSSRAANAYCKAYKGVANESAAQIIAKVGQACGISPKVLLVMLEKEQSLVTDTWPTVRQFDVAMGYACPDSGPGNSANCDPSQTGFMQQVYRGAWQLKVYKANPNSYNYKPFKTNTIQWHPNTGCGTSQVYITNWATAALYIYTPYRPNQAALNAGWGTGDSCSSYGNRNFYNFYKQWFGSPNTRWVDVPTTHPFYTHIEWMGANGYAASGNDALYFNPTNSTTRGAMATFLRRMMEPGYKPSASLQLPYKDVPKSNPHYAGIAWMYERGYAASAEYYNPGNAVTRGAMATFLYRLQNGSADGVTSKPPYRDVPANNVHARAIAWMAKKGYAASGSGNPDFNPAQPMKRQAMAAFLYRVYG